MNKEWEGGQDGKLGQREERKCTEDGGGGQEVSIPCRPQGPSKPQGCQECLWQPQAFQVKSY